MDPSPAATSRTVTCPDARPGRRRAASLTVLLALVLTGGWAAPGPAPAHGAPGRATVTPHVVASFDGVLLETFLFLPPGAGPHAPVPLVLRTHGWAGRAQRSPGGTLQRLLDAGYGVLTWDQRGFGCSGGVVELDSPDHEARDVSALIDWAVDNAPVATDATGDPLVGMTGGSYAGGIQTVAAALDPRIDAIAPEMSWHDLRRALFAGRVVNESWATLLYAGGQSTAETGGLDPSCHTVRDARRPQPGGLARWLHELFASAALTNQVPARGLERLGARSPAVYGREHAVRVPTLVMNGTVDTLFDLTEGARLAEAVRAAGAPARLIGFCGGHVTCPASYDRADDRAHLDRATVAWLDRHVRGRAVDTGPPVEYRTNRGGWRASAQFPPTDARPRRATGEASLLVLPDLPALDVRDLLDSLRRTGQVPPVPATTARVAHRHDPRAASVTVTEARDGPLELVGVPRATVTVTGRVLGVEDAAHLFLRLVDRESGEVVNLQEAPIRVREPSGTPRTISVQMPGVAYTLREGHHLDLQVATSSTMHAGARAAGRLTVRIEATVPVLESVTRP